MKCNIIKGVNNDEVEAYSLYNKKCKFQMTFFRIY